MAKNTVGAGVYGGLGFVLDISQVELQRQLAQTQKAMRDHIDQSHSTPFSIPLERLTRWREIALPSQELLRSFLIRPPAAAASQATAQARP